MEAAQSVCEPRVMVVINPGNPTGKSLSIKDIVLMVPFVLTLLITV